MDGPDYRQQEEAEQEQWELAETIAWYKARREQFNQSDEESENEHRYFNHRGERHRKEHCHAQP